MEKLLKTIETLKMPSLSSSDANIPGTITSAVVAAGDSIKTKKKERIIHCRGVTDAVCTSSVQGLTDYPKILESVIEVLFQLCNDQDSDIRLVASDCLNRIARTLKDNLQPRFHMEVYKEIRKNQSPRCLRTAYNLFAFISPMIRPQKCRAFMASLLPCFAQVSNRTEELLYENLSTSLTEIFRHLGPFAHESEIKILCKDFISNLESTSAIIRRASASILVSICRYSKKPHVFLAKLLSQITELLMPNLMEKSVSVIIGVLLCIRQCIPPIYDEIQECGLRRSSPEQDAVVTNLVQVYEMCMILCNHDDHNVITTSLETLQQLLTNPAEPLTLRLTSPSGIQNSLDDKVWSSRQTQNSLATTSMESLSFTDETVNLLEADMDMPKFRSLISSSVSDAQEDMETDSYISSRRDSDVFAIEGTMSEGDIASSSDGLHPSDEETALKSEKTLCLQTFPDIQIGSLYEKNVPIYYCARFLSYNFLLAGQKGIIRPDVEIRISVKVLATNCIVNMIAMSPLIFSLTLSHVLVEAGNETDQQKIEDLCLYATHNDPLLRGSIYVMAGTFIKSSILHSNGGEEPLPGCLENILNQGLRDSSNVGVKCAISGVNNCLGSLLEYPQGVDMGKILFQEVLKTAVNPYWLVKVDLLELLSSVNWDSFDSTDKFQERVVSILLEFLCDEDSRVRTMAATAIIRFMKKYALIDNCESEQLSLFCKQCVINEVNVNSSLLASRKAQPCSKCDRPCESGSAKILELILNKLFQNLAQQEHRYAIAGYYSALAMISESYEPQVYKAEWRCKQSVGDVNLFLALSTDTLRSSPVVYDLAVHQSILSLAGSLFRASEFYEVGSEKAKSIEEGNPFRCCNKNVSNYGIQILQHCLAVMKLYQTVIESVSHISPLRKQSSSPVISPVKKFSQKLEAEKKSQEIESDKKGKGLSFSDTVCPIHFKRISDSLTQSYKVYKSSLDPLVTIKFTSLLTTALNTFGRIFPCIRSDFPAMKSLMEEVLNVCSAIFCLGPIPVLRSVREMLRCIFCGFDPESAKTDVINASSKVSDIEDFVSFSNSYENVLVENRPMITSKAISDKSALGNFIRQFESVVVAALKIYTTSSDVEIQAEVLSLLSQLVKGRVNYGLVDSSQVFLGFVIKQVGYLEDGQIRGADLLVQEMFQFLTLLTHELHSSKKFIDLPKLLQLCDSLVTAGESSMPLATSLAIPAMKQVVNDLFIYRGTSSQTNLEKQENESLREVALQMLLKLASFPEAIPVMWILAKGRKINNVVKWNENSETILSYILPRILNGDLTIRKISHMRCLCSLIHSVSIYAIPSQEKMVSLLVESLRAKNVNAESFLRWQTNILVVWYLLERRLLSEEEIDPMFTSSLVLNLLEKFLADAYVMKKAHNGTKSFSYFSRSFHTTMTMEFMALLWTILGNEKLDRLRNDLRSDNHTAQLLRICNYCYRRNLLSMDHYMLEILLISSNPNVELYEEVLNSSRCFSAEMTEFLLKKIINKLNCYDIPTIEEFIIVVFAPQLLDNLSDPDINLFINRLSTYRLEQILDQITLFLSMESNVQELQVKCFLKYLERVACTFLCETAILGIKLLQKVNAPFLILEISQFCCYAFTHIMTRKLLFSLKDRLTIQNYLFGPAGHVKCQKLITIASKVLAEDPSSSVKTTLENENPILEWCCAEFSSAEGIPLAKMLNGLKYVQVVNILNQPKFNLSLLKYCFRDLAQHSYTGCLSKNEITDLLTSQKRSGLIERWPAAVAGIEFIVETLDRWELMVSEPTTKLDSKYAQDLIRNATFKSKLPHMWAALTEILLLKNLAVKVGGSEDKENCNNFIPTKIFTMSFQYMAAKCQFSPNDILFEELRIFLKFASIAVCDGSFLSFFDVRDNHTYIFACVTSLGSILRNVVASLGVFFLFGQSSSDLNADMNDDCIEVLSEFYYLTEFVQQVQKGKFSLDAQMFQELKTVIAGLGRCELINGWILISHLGWTPQVLSKSQIFPPIQQIPLEILRNETDMLLKYIAKLNLLGVASKIQFEENWVIFLSVINLYVDESFQLQIVSTGLRALSMMLQQSIKILFKISYVSVEKKHAANKIRMILGSLEPEMCKKITFPLLISKSTRKLENVHGVDVNSCIRFLTDLYTQWLQNPQGKMPLHLLSEVVQSIVAMSEYFEDPTQYSWMYETLIEVHKSFEKDDEILWPHLVFGIFYSAAKLTLEGEAVTNLAQILEGSLSSPSANVANASLHCALAYLQNHPDSLVILNVVVPYVLKSTQLDEITNDSEMHCRKVWDLLLFIWVHGPKEGIAVPDFEQETIRNILTVLSPLNKVYVSVRLVVLKGLCMKVQIGDLKADVKKTITKVAIETLRTPNISVFYQSVVLYLVIFYADFSEFINATDPDPEVLMHMAERSEVLFQLLKSNMKYNNQIVSRALDLVVADFLPPSEILNRVIAEFMSPTQTSPELLAPAVARVFMKAKRRPKEAALVREWILSSLPNFIASSDISRIMWSLTLFFIGVSSTDVCLLLPYAQLRRRPEQILDLFLHSVSDFYQTVDEGRREAFKKLIVEGAVRSNEKKPYDFIIDLIERQEAEKESWAIDKESET